MNPESCTTPFSFEPEAFQAHWGEIHLHLSAFFAGYLSRLYRDFSGDLVAVVILAEIAHHNLAQYFSEHHVDGEAIERFVERKDYSALQPCNAFSIAQATAIPRETVRRKVRNLVEAGLLEQDRSGCVRISPECNRFSGSTMEILNQFLTTARRIERVLSSPASDKRRRSRRAATRQ